VIDEQAPTITNCNNGITITSIPDQCGTYVYWDDPVITDNCSFTLSHSHVSGSFFEVGTTLVTYTATDATGNSSTCSFYVTVKDTTPAIVTCSRPINSCDSYILYPLPTALDNCGVQSIIQISGLPSGSNFPVGLTNNVFEVTDIHGNKASCSVDVIIFPTPVVTLNTTNVRCFGEQNGSIDLSVSSPNVYYTYLWSNNAQTQDINGLAAGTYSVYVADEYGCYAVSETTIYEPQNLLISAEKQNVSCFEGNDGSVQISVSGGVLPYNYLWSNGQTTSLASQLTPGVYSILVTDANRCVRSYETNISQPDSLVINFTIKDAICNAPNGSINVAVTGGTVPYNFNWSNQTNGPTLSNVVAGNYTLVIQDGNNCTYRYSKTIGTIHNFYASMNATDVTCQGSSNGSIDFVLRGNSPFTFEWFGDNPVNLDSVSSGTYLVHITDSFGCDTTITILIQEPDSLAISLTSETYSTGTNISTYQGQDGSILSTVTGGTEPYLYNWSNGEASENIYNLSAGSYVLTVTDANGCITKAGILLTEPYLLEMPSGFSPNGDGSNDFFVVRGIEYYSHNEITVYNRWGNKVYSKTYYSNEWNGDNNQGESLPDGTYFVILTVFNEPDITLKHYVDLRR
jgi:gliding motility-associated-like protein